MFAFAAAQVHQQPTVRTYNVKIKLIYDDQKAADRAKFNREQLLNLATETGIRVPLNFYWSPGTEPTKEKNHPNFTLRWNPSLLIG